MARRARATAESVNQGPVATVGFSRLSSAWKLSALGREPTCRPRPGLVAALAGLVAALLAFAAAAPAALARPFPPRSPGWDKHPLHQAGIHAVVTGGLPGWQIALIVIGAALLAATVAVLLYRARARARQDHHRSRLNYPGRQPVPDRPQPGPGGATAGRPGR